MLKFSPLYTEDRVLNKTTRNVDEYFPALTK